MLDSFVHVEDAALLASAARQLRQEYHVEAEAIRAVETVADRRRKAGDLLAADRCTALADELRGAVPVLLLAAELDAEARALKQPVRVTSVS